MFETLTKNLNENRNKEFERKGLQIIMEEFNDDEEITEFISTIEDDRELEVSDDEDEPSEEYLVSTMDEIDSLIEDIEDEELDELLNDDYSLMLEEIDTKISKEDEKELEQEMKKEKDQEKKVVNLDDF